MRPKYPYFAYILASRKLGTLYTGVTNNIIARSFQHKNDLKDGFTKKYGVHRLVHYEVFDDIGYAIKREKQIKRWKRQWKIDLIEQNNPNWDDLYNYLE